MTLPEWPGGDASGAVVVHAADVDADWLRSALAPRDASWIVAPGDARVSGRITATTRADAWTAARAAEPSLATTPPRLGGGGIKVDLDFVHAPLVDLFRVLADVSGTNVVMRAPPATVDIRVRRAGALAVMNEVARVTGRRIERPAKNVLVVSVDTQAPLPRLSTRGSKVQLAARGARAGDVLVLIHELEPSPVPASVGIAALVCTPGATVELRVERVPRDAVRELVGALGGVPSHQVGCTVRRVQPSDAATLELVATASLGTRRLGLGMVGGTPVLIDDNDPQWEVGEAHVAFQPAPDDPTTLAPLYPSPFASATPAPAAARALDQARLALTVVDGADSLAIIELDGVAYRVTTRSDTPWLVSARIGDVDVQARIAAGVVELIDPETHLPLETLRLQAR